MPGRATRSTAATGGRFYRDKQLDVLIRQVEISNQNVAVQAAAYEQARAVIREAQASLFPMLTGSYSATRTRRGPNVSGGGGGGFGAGGGGGGGGGTYSTTYTPSLNGTWDLDVWGKVRRQIESNTAAAQASAADLDNVKLSAQARLPPPISICCATDALHDLLARTVEEYKQNASDRANQFNAGYSVTSGDVATAEGAVETTRRRKSIPACCARNIEHAIAMLIGRPPAELTVGHHDLAGTPCRATRSTIPSTLLERRPDIAAAERTMQEAERADRRCRGGVFPGHQPVRRCCNGSADNPLPFSAANEVWSLGAAALAADLRWRAALRAG